MVGFSGADPQPPAAPVCTVVIVSIHGEDALSQCLESVERARAHANPFSTEVRVVGHWFKRPPVHLRQRYPDVDWISADVPVPLLRLQGILQARGQVVALLEDDCICPPGWFRTVQHVLNEDAGAIGGVVRPGPYRWPWEWAMYFYEYGTVMPTHAAGGDFRLSGAHVIYRRDALMRFLRSTLQESAIVYRYGFYEFFVHRGLQRLGYRGRLEPQLAVEHTRFRPYRTQLRAAFHHGRAFAGIRTERMHGWQRILRSLLFGGLPALMVARILRRIGRDRPFLIRLILALPWLILLMLMWSMGEAYGYLRGPGRSLQQWR